MSWPDFVVQMSQAWAWPVVAGSAIILLRKQIKSAAEALVARVGDIRRLKAPGVDVEFEREMRELAETTAATTEELQTETPNALPPAQPEDVVLPPETAEERLTKYQQLAQLDPRAAVLLPFSDMERFIRERFQHLYPNERPTVGFSRIVDILHREGWVSDDIAGALRTMSRLRNQVAHEKTDFDLDIANYFVESVGNVLGYLVLTGFFTATKPKA
jgi:hypothetical protein